MRIQFPMPPRKPLRVLGIMSGTSLDGVDFALCSIRKGDCNLLDLQRAPFPKLLRKQLQACAQGNLSSHQTASLHHQLGRFYARLAERLFPSSKPHLAGLHGQTIFHHSSPQNSATLQIGEPAYLAARLGIPVIANFRAADLAQGGEGAPLATLFHLHVLCRSPGHTCVQNIGGIANVTSVIRHGRRSPQVLSFDTGPGNMLIDLAVQLFTANRRKFDQNGRWAARGRIHHDLVDHWLQNHAFFRRKPPKSTGREEFGEPFLHQALQALRKGSWNDADTLATLTEFTARSISLSYHRFLPTMPDRVVLCGGGALNNYLRQRLLHLLASNAASPACEVVTSQMLSWPVNSIEPAAFAYLAYCWAVQQPGNLPAATGAQRPTLLGHCTLPPSSGI